MTARLVLLAWLLVFAPLAIAQDAFTNRATELKESAAAEALTLASLPADTAVKVTARGGGWARVETLGRAGWLRVFHLRFPATTEGAAPVSSSLSAITGALGFGRERSREATIATTGVRGLTPEDLKNAAPDAEALRRLHSYRVDAPAAERFAREGKLSAIEVDYNESSRR